jgi:hypothetical protein
LSAPVLSWPFIARRPPCGASPGKLHGSNARVTTGIKPTLQDQAGCQRPGPQSQSFSRSYGSILPTSLIYIVLLTRGCTPWRPDAVISTPRGASKTRAGIFKDRPEGTRRTRELCALPNVYPYLRVNRFQGNDSLTSKENACWTSVRRLPAPFRVTAIPTPWLRNINRIPFR